MAQGNKPQITIVPEKIKIDNGCPTMEIQSINLHIDQWVRTQKKLAKLTDKASDILSWQLVDMHECLNPKNIGKVKTVKVENPKFDQSKPISEDNPFFLEEYEHAFNPMKYKENTISTVANSFLKNTEQRIREMAEQEKELRKLEREAKKTLEEVAKAHGSEETFSTESLLDMSDWEADDAKPN